ncbi:MAG: hypothetical protein INQ03_23410 [Candidatus Heimdallarchaeota archaeon]|nr:hypothetical protein [Candidatus Heimdallarchaeota archaeon]
MDTSQQSSFSVLRSRKALISLFIVLLMSTSPLSSAEASSDMLKATEASIEEQLHYYTFDYDLFVVFYDAETILTNETGLSLYHSLSLMTPNIVAIPITDLADIEKVLINQAYFAAFYVFQSDENGLKIHRGDKHYSWSRVNEVLSKSVSTQHIMAMGNSYQLLNGLSRELLPNVHGTGAELEDAQQLFIYSLWTLADILEASPEPKRQKLGNDVRMATLQYFADNFNELVASTVEPTSPMGRESPQTVQARVDKFYAEHPAEVTKIPRPGYIIDPVTQKNVNPVTGEVANDYVMDIFKPDSAASDFILNMLPLESGQRGPIGGILDVLLGFLFDQIGGAIGLDTATVEQIVSALTAIPDLIGAISDPNASAIKGFIDKLKPMLPIPDDMYKYVDLLIDGLFLIRGDFDDIKGFIGSAVGLIVPDMQILGKSLPDLITDIIDLGDGIVDRIQEGGNIVDIILSVLNENIVSTLLETFIGNNTAILGLVGNEIPQTITKMVSGFKALINTVSTFNLKDFIMKYGPDLMTTLFDGLGISTENLQMIMGGVGILMYAAGLHNNNGLDTVKDLLIQMLGTATDVSDIFVIEAAAEAVVKAIGKITEGTYTDITSLTNDVTAALEVLNIDEDIVNAIKSISGIVAKLTKPDLSLSGIGTLSSVLEDLLAAFDVEAGLRTSIKTIMDGLIGVFGYIKDIKGFKDVVGDIMSGADITKQVSALIKEIIKLVKPSFGSLGLDTAANDLISSISEGIGMIMQMLSGFNGNSFQSIMMSLLNAGSFLIAKISGVDIKPYIEVFKALFGQLLGITDSVPTASELANLVAPLIPGVSVGDLNTLFTLLLAIQDVFQNGFQSIFAKLTEYLMGLVTDLIGKLTGEIGGILGDDTWDLVDMDIPIGIGAFSLFTINIKIGIAPHIEFDTEMLTNMILDLVFKGINFFNPEGGGAGLTPDAMSAGDILRKALSFFSISPILEASFELSDFGSGSSGFLTFMLEALGVELEISGYGYFKMLLFSFKNGGFSFDDFLKVLEWGFGFSITISRTFTLLDFLTGGAGGSLNSIGKYIGLDAISITIYFTIALDIVKRAATANAPETGSLTIALTIGFTVSLGIDIFIAELRLTGTLEITLTLLQDLVSSTPMRVFISIELIITVTIGFLFWDWDFDFHWSPDGFEPPLGYELTPSTPEAAVEQGALGGDTDKDGLSDEYEKNTAGLDYTKADTDGDGLDDKYETQTLETDPSKPDTDGDGIDDKTELDINTNPLQPDTDFDGLNDYEEAYIYGTNTNTQDTDFDGLSDYYEVTHAWNISGVTPTVSQIMIGGVPYDDRTDPLNPDTDFDGLIDGEEGPRGINYGGAVSYCQNADTPEERDYCSEFLSDPANTQEDKDNLIIDILGYLPDAALIFNDGYTHPLDADTDDDSYWQLYDGSKAPMDEDRLFLMDMSDYVEIHGISVIFIDTETGEPEPARIVRTNPCNPDSDGDTGITADQVKDPPFGFFINSDGYELSRDPPTDPLDGDTDDDGLIDGLEGMLRPDSNHTWGLNPDTDGDGLGDYQEIKLGTDGRSVDTDLDGVTDGDEFFIYGTNPFLADTDSDGLEDGEELFLYHSSPFLRDTDADGLLDYDEVWKYFSKPADEDSDNDFLTDWEEIMIYYTDPFNEDTDGDGLLDGEEIDGFEVEINGSMKMVYTDPTRWDTDNDSITFPGPDGKMSQSMSDRDEVLMGLDPTIRDTDLDGIQDGWEVYLASGKIPWMDPVMLDPDNPDTDGDGIADGVEMQVVNSTMLLYPFIAFTLEQPYNSRPDMADTDGDGLTDDVEIFQLYSRADKIDTDNDTLNDYEEYVIHKTDLHLNDTDGDGLFDADEVYGVNATKYNPSFPLGTTFFTHPNRTDSDGDLLPDGAEIIQYTMNPTVSDENGNDILDGMEIDEDKDGLWAGEEYFVYGTVGSPHASRTPGGDNNPDSDADGLFDGLEVYETLSDPANWDTDNDTFSDGLEYYCKTGILDNSTTKAEIEACMSGLVRISIISPASKTYRTNTAPVIVYDSTGTMVDMTYRYRNLDDEVWVGDFDMTETSRPQYWEGEYLSLPPVNATYELEVTASNGTHSYTRSVVFKVDLFGGDVELLSPVADFEYSFGEFTAAQLPVEVQTALEYNATWFRIRYADNNTIYLDNTTLTYEGGRGTWYNPSVSFPKIRGVTKYAIEIFARKGNGDITQLVAVFSIKIPTVQSLAALGGGAVAGLTIATFAMRKVAKGGFKSPFSKKS